jgi:hypothetical protein
MWGVSNLHRELLSWASEGFAPDPHHPGGGHTYQTARPPAALGTAHNEKRGGHCQLFGCLCAVQSHMRAVTNGSNAPRLGHGFSTSHMPFSS